MKSIFFQPKLILFAFALLALPISCSKDDDAKPDEGGSGETVEIYRSQIVKIELPSAVEIDEYEAKLGDTTLTAIKFNENTIAFQVPSSYTLGEAEFKLPDLDLDIHYDIKETVLTQSAEETLAPFMDEIDQISEEITDEDTEEAEYLRTVIAEFGNYYATMSDMDKQAIAKYYKANTAIFNDIFHADLNGGRMDEILGWLGKYGVHTVAFGTGVAIVVLAPEPAEKAVGALLAIVAWKKAKGYFGELMNAGLDTVKVGFDSIWSNKNENATDETITFISGEPYTATLNMQRKNATTANQNSGTQGFTDFFNSLDILSIAVDKLNGIIEFVNDNVFFANISLVPVITMPTESPLMTETAETDSYESLQFSVTAPGVEIGNVSFADGEISITLNALNDEDSIETTLNYTYEDEFSHFTGSFPVMIGETSGGDCIPTGSVTDVDGNSYGTIIIDNKEWMQANLNVSRYRNGDPIPQVQNLNEWLTTTTGAWCYYENDSENGTVYGKLYNWYAVSDPRGLAPEGWHIPSHEEFIELRDFLGNSGGALMSTTGWENEPNTNETCFSAMPAGIRWTGDFTYGGESTAFWSTTVDPQYSDSAWFLGIGGPISGMLLNSRTYKDGISVRCIKD